MPLVSLRSTIGPKMAQIGSTLAHFWPTTGQKGTSEKAKKSKNQPWTRTPFLLFFCFFLRPKRDHVGPQLSKFGQTLAKIVQDWAQIGQTLPKVANNGSIVMHNPCSCHVLQADNPFYLFFRAMAASTQLTLSESAVLQQIHRSISCVIRYISIYNCSHAYA